MVNNKYCKQTLLPNLRNIKNQNKYLKKCKIVQVLLSVQKTTKFSRSQTVENIIVDLGNDSETRKNAY